MDKITITFLLIFLLVSCKSEFNLSGKTFISNDNEQFIKISFIDKEICEVEQKFYCIKVPDTLRENVSKAKYNVIKSNIKYLKKNKTKSFKVHFITLENIDTFYIRNSKKYTLIPDYQTLCDNYLSVNSNEIKLRDKIGSGIILNLVNDTLVIFKDTIVFGYKKIPIHKPAAKKAPAPSASLPPTAFFANPKLHLQHTRLVDRY